MVTQKVKPDPGTGRRPEDRGQRRRQTLAKVGTYGLVTVVVVVVAAAVFAVASGDPTPGAAPPGQPSVTGSPEAGWSDLRTVGTVGLAGLPPKGAEPSTPVRGKQIMSDAIGGFHVYPAWSVHVYADGRMIWTTTASPSREQRFGLPRARLVVRPAQWTGWLERRLTPEGVELVRSGAVWWRLPASAFEDGKAKPYVPARYAVCPNEAAIRAPLFRLQRVQDLLLGDEETAKGCPVVTIGEARVIDTIFGRKGMRGEANGSLSYHIGYAVVIDVRPILPNGQVAWFAPHTNMG